MTNLLLSSPSIARLQRSKLQNAVALANDRLKTWANSDSYYSLLQRVYSPAQKAAASLRSKLLRGNLQIPLEILPATTLGGNNAAYASAAPYGGECIYINDAWLQAASISQLEATLLEEIGHAIDYRLNGAKDSSGDEGEIFSALIRGQQPAISAATENDQRLIRINGVSVAIEASDIIAPRVSQVASSTANGSYGIGAVITLTVQFSEVVLVTTTGGSPTLQLKTGSIDRFATYTSGSGTNTLSFTYTVQVGDTSGDLDQLSANALTLNAGSIRDAAGNNAILTLAAPGAAGSLGANKALVIDGVAPTTTAAVTAITDNVGIIQGPVASGAITDDSSLSISGTISAALAAGETVRIYDGATFLGTATLSGTTWSYADARMLSNNQIVSYTARVADAAGNLRLAYSNLANSNRSYYMLSRAGTWTEAQAEAVSMGGNLVTINDGAENQFLVNTFGGTEGLWIGLTDEVEEGRFKWANGEAAAYRNWYPGEPNNAGNEDYAEFNHVVAGKWNDRANLGKLQKGIIELPGYIITVDTTAPATTAAVIAITDNFGIFQGTVISGATTDDSSLSISGTISAALAAGETVRIYDGATYLGTATVSGTTWSYADSRTLSNNQIVSYTAKVADAAGNQSAAGTAYTATIDTSAPAAPTLALANDTGSSNSDGVTNDGRINITGLEAAASWEYSTDSGDSWLPGTGGSFDLLVGTYAASSIRVRQSDSAGNTSAEVSLLPGLKTSSIEFLASTGHYYEFISDGFIWAEAKDLAASKTFYGAQGYLATITSAEENALLASLKPNGNWVWIGASDAETEGVWKWVTGPEAGSVLWNGGPSGTAPPGIYANWQPGSEPNNLGNEDAAFMWGGGYWNDSYIDLGSLGYFVEYGALADSFSVTVDNVTPAKPVLELDSDTGKSNSDRLTSNSTINITGLETGATWQFSTNGGANWSTAQSATTFSSSFSVAAGSYTTGQVQVRQTDVAGNSGPANTSFQAFTVDTAAPTVTISDSDPNTVNIADGKVTFTFTFSEAVTGFSAAGITVGNGTKGTFSGSGTTYTLDVTPTAFSAGNITVDVSTTGVTDAAGNQATAPAQYLQPFDTLAPTVTISDSDPNTVNIADGKVTFTFTFSEAVTGFSAAGITVGNGTKGTFSGSGTTYTLDVTPTASSAGNITVDVSTTGVTDAAGNQATALAQYLQPFDTLAPPTPTITGIADNVGLIRGNFIAGAFTDDTTPTLSGTLSVPLGSDEELVILSAATYRIPGKPFEGGTFMSDGTTWSFTLGGIAGLPSTPRSLYAVSARVVDRAGNFTTSNSFTFYLDTVAPTITAAITAVSDNVGRILGAVSQAGFTDDSTPTISGTISGRLGTGDTLRIFNGNDDLGIASVNNINNSWSFTPSGLTPLANGFYAITARVADTAGNLGNLAPASAVQRFSIDSTAKQIIGDANANTLSATTAKDVLTGLGGIDTFAFTTLTSSTLANFDRITDLSIGTDILDGPDAITSAEINKLGLVASLDESSISTLLTSSTFLANKAATFSHVDPSSISRSFIALNDGIAGYSASNDAIIEITGYTGLLANLFLS